MLRKSTQEHAEDFWRASTLQLYRRRMHYAPCTMRMHHAACTGGQGGLVPASAPSPNGTAPGGGNHRPYNLQAGAVIQTQNAGYSLVILEGIEGIPLSY